MKTSDPVYQRIASEPARALNKALLEGYLHLRDAPGTRQSHYFDGRYENIYISPAQLPAYAQVLDIARQHAAELLGKKPAELKVGGWFNAMAPGQATTLHRHDDDDEVLSAVYYVSVPADSGELVLHPAEGPVTLTPEEGYFVFFSPAVPHEVTTNQADSLRLSIGMNFGYDED